MMWGIRIYIVALLELIKLLLTYVSAASDHGVEHIIIGPQFNYEQCFGENSLKGITFAKNILKRKNGVEKPILLTMKTYCDLHWVYKKAVEKRAKEGENVSYHNYWPFLLANETVIEKMGCNEVMSEEDYEQFAVNVCNRQALKYGDISNGVKYLNFTYNSVAPLNYYANMESTDSSFIFGKSIKQIVDEGDQLEYADVDYVPRYKYYNQEVKVVILFTNVDYPEILTYHEDLLQNDENDPNNSSNNFIQNMKKHPNASIYTRYKDLLSISSTYLNEKDVLKSMLKDSNTALIPLQVNCNSEYIYTSDINSNHYDKTLPKKMQVSPFEAIFGLAADLDKPELNNKIVDSNCLMDDNKDINAAYNLKPITSIIPHRKKTIQPICLFKNSSLPQYNKDNLDAVLEIMRLLINKRLKLIEDERIEEPDIVAEAISSDLSPLIHVERPIAPREVMQALVKEDSLPNDILGLSFLINRDYSDGLKGFNIAPNFSDFLANMITHFYLLLEKIAMKLNTMDNPVYTDTVYYRHALVIPYSYLGLMNTYYPILESKNKCRDFTLYLSAKLKTRESKLDNRIYYVYVPEINYLDEYCFESAENITINFMFICKHTNDSLGPFGVVADPNQIMLVDATYIKRKNVDALASSINLLKNAPHSVLSENPKYDDSTYYNGATYPPLTIFNKYNHTVKIYDDVVEGMLNGLSCTSKQMIDKTKYLIIYKITNPSAITNLKAVKNSAARKFVSLYKEYINQNIAII